jgi:PAS domain S-box-containing protein
MNSNPRFNLTSQESDLRFRALFDAAAEFIFVIDPDGQILLTNRYVSEQSGYAPEELTGRHIKEFFTESSKQLCDCNFPVLRSKGHTRAETEFLCKDGRVLQMECNATGIPDTHGEYASFLIVQRDITERKRAAEALANSERKFRAIFNSTFQFIGMLSPDGTLLEANKSALEFIDATEKDVVGRPFWETAWWSGLRDEQERLKSAIRRAAQGELVRYETTHRSKDGKITHFDFSLKPVKNEQGETVLIIPEGRDITERRLADEIACQHQRESAHLMRVSIMGEMAGSIAHELNQPLTALVSYCGTAVSQIKDNPMVPDGVRHVLALATDQAHRASDIIRHIRRFISKGDTSKNPVDVDQLIGDMSKLLEWELCNSKVTISLDLDGRGHKVMANRVQIEQVFLNLVRNSIEAIQGAGISDGRVTLRTRAPENACLLVTVEDNGPGIDPAMRDSIFQAFQTSHRAGMGMGLSISRSIIQTHGGKLWVAESDPGKTVFCIKLPLQQQDHD